MDKIILYVWESIAGNGTLSALFLMLWTLMVKLLLISLYFSLLYCGILFLKKCLYNKMSIRANYYCWYVLICSVVLANVSFNNGFISLSYYYLYSVVSYTPYVYLLGCLLSVAWLSVVIYKLTALSLMKHRIKNSMKHMERYDDSERLAERAATALKLRKKLNILIADYIDTPVSYGVFKKTILLPVNFKEKYSADELYLLLLHEAAHIKNNDTTKLHIVNLTECFLWITPVVRLFGKNFKRDSEILCDNRVIGIQGGERDAYGSLILKECADRNSAMGFGFSDSYHALETRLDALYRYKADSRLKMLAVIPIAALVICALSFVLRADWFVINDKFNSEFEIGIYKSDYTDFVTLPPEVCAGVYKITDEGYCIDTIALRELIGPYAESGYSVVDISSNNYRAEMDKVTLSSVNGNSFSFDELERVQENNRYSRKRIAQRTPVEYLLLLITSKL